MNRKLVAIAAAVIATAGVGGLRGVSTAAVGSSSPPLKMFSDQLPIPPEIDGRAGGAFSLDEIVAVHRFGTLSSGQALPSTPSFAYWPSTLQAPADAYLGPTIEAARGTPLAMTVVNRLTVRGTDSEAPDVCQSLGLSEIHPMAKYFDDTIEGTSDLDECAPATATHLHGGHTQVASDGEPMDTYRAAGISPGDYANGTGSYTYRYVNDQEAAQLWYHDHAQADTRFNPMAGLAGNYLVRDAWDTGRPGNPLGLPANGTFATLGSDGGLPVLQPVDPYEIPLVLQDRQFNPDGTLAYPPGVTTYHPTWAPESFGDVATVNGMAWPNLDVDRGLYRLRVLNGSNARFYRLTLVDAKTSNLTRIPIYQIGSDGGPVNAPASLPGGQLLISPGERADLLVDFRGAPSGSAYRWMNNAPAPFPKGSNNLKRIMQFTVGTRKGFAGPVPAVLRGPATGDPAIPAANPGTAVRTRTVFLNEVGDAVQRAPVEVLLNNLNFLDATGRDRTTGIERPHVNTVEIWTIANTTMDAHPMHLHATEFQVLSRQKFDAAAYLQAVNPSFPDPFPFDPAAAGSGVRNSDGAIPPPDVRPYLKGQPKAPAANEAGWKDTVIAYPGQVVRILVPFGGTAAGISAAFTGDPVGGVQRFTGTYVWHCHILEHEENDMMQPYVIRP